MLVSHAQSNTEIVKTAMTMQNSDHQNSMSKVLLKHEGRTWVVHNDYTYLFDNNIHLSIYQFKFLNYMQCYWPYSSCRKSVVKHTMLGNIIYIAFGQRGTVDQILLAMERPLSRIFQYYLRLLMMIMMSKITRAQALCPHSISFAFVTVRGRRQALTITRTL